jgi:hypothetical protein
MRAQFHAVFKPPMTPSSSAKRPLTPIGKLGLFGSGKKHEPRRARLLRAFGSDGSISAAAPSRISMSVCRVGIPPLQLLRNVCFRVEAEPLGHQPQLKIPLISEKPDAEHDLKILDVAHLQRSARRVSQRLAQVSDEIVVRLLVFWRLSGQHGIRFDELASAIVNLR